MPVIEPYEASISGYQETANEVDQRRREDAEEQEVRGSNWDDISPAHPRAYIPTGASGAEESSTDVCSKEHTSMRHSGTKTPPQVYQLSASPNSKLGPTQRPSRPLPSIPQQSNSFSSTAYQPHPAYPVEEWTARTPSPVKSIRKMISTPPLIGRKGFAPSSLVNVLTNVWKRRGLSSESSNRTESRNSSRSIP